MTRNIAASIHARLLSRAKQRNEEFNLVLTRYAIERFLYRLSKSAACESFCLKGALLFDLWFDVPHRPTHDADFLSFGEQDVNALTTVIQETCTVAADDGIVFHAASINIAEIRKQARYGGLRVSLIATLGNARCAVRLDFGFGDAVTPGPENASYPVMLEGMPPALLKVYPRATVIAEKLEALVSLGMTNSRMKDYFDLHILLRDAATDSVLIGDAIYATFRRRGTELPNQTPVGLSDEFAIDANKCTQWQAFLRKNGLADMSLVNVVEIIRSCTETPFSLARKRR